MSYKQLSPHASEFRPSKIPVVLQPEEADPFDQVCICMSALADHPESTSQILDELNNQLAVSIQDDETFTSLVQFIITQSIQQQFCQYNGARLCAFLNQNLAYKPSTEGLNFRDVLLRRCQEEFKEVTTAPELHIKHVGLTFFIGELMLNMKHESGRVISIFVIAVLRLLTKFLDFLTDDTVQCFMQAIELTGRTLEEVTPEEYKELLSKMNSTMPSKLSPHAPEFIPRNNVLQHEEDPFDQVRRCMAALAHYPESTSQILDELNEQLAVSIQDDETFTSLVQFIITQCIQQQYCQYNGARLCAYLNQNLAYKPSTEGLNFRDVLLRRCQEEFKEITSVSVLHHNLIGLTFFLSELMLNMKHESGRVINVFVVAVLRLLTKFLDFLTDDTVQCFMQAIKLTSITLDEEAPDKCDELFSNIKEILVDDDTTRRQRSILLDLVILKVRKWIPESESLSSNVEPEDHSTVEVEQPGNDSDNHLPAVDCHGDGSGYYSEDGSNPSSDHEQRVCDGDYEFDSGDQMLADYMEFLLDNEIAFEQAFVQYD